MTAEPSSNTQAVSPAPDVETMEAIFQAGYGSADVLQLGEIARPIIGDSEVLIRVHAAGVDRGVASYDRTAIFSSAHNPHSRISRAQESCSRQRCGRRGQRGWRRCHEVPAWG